MKMIKTKVAIVDALNNDIAPNALYVYANRSSGGHVSIAIGKLTNATDNGMVTLTVIRRSRTYSGEVPEIEKGPHRKSSILSNTLVPIQMKHLSAKEKKAFRSIPDVKNLDLTMVAYKLED